MAEAQPNSRLETFCDGVFAIALTLLIIDIKIPASDAIGTTRDLWLALGHLAPSVLAVVLSFAIILITWVNHHATLEMINRSSASFIYANGFLLLTVVFVPFPTGLLGEFLLTDHAAPAVALYNAVLAAQAFGWILLTNAALNNQLTIDDKSTSTMREGRRNGYFAFALYSIFSITALWFPIAIAVVTTVSWIFSRRKRESGSAYSESMRRIRPSGLLRKSGFR
jgi:uncharacterized membrane protein